MGVKLDVKTILGMFQQSKMQAEESIDKARLTEVNRQLEQQKIGEESRHNLATEKTLADGEANRAIMEKAQAGDLDAQRALREWQGRVRGKAKDLFPKILHRYVGDKNLGSDITNGEYDTLLARYGSMYDADQRAASERANRAAAKPIPVDQGALGLYLKGLSENGIDPNGMQQEGSYYLSDKNQSENNDRRINYLNSINKMLDYNSRMMQDGTMAKGHVNPLLYSRDLYSQAKQALGGMLGDSENMVSDEDTFGGDWTGGYTGKSWDGKTQVHYPSEDSYRKWETRKYIQHLNQRLSANPWANTTDKVQQ